MSLHFHLSMNFELEYDTPTEIVNVFTKKMNGNKLSEDDKKIFPRGYDLEYLLEPKTKINDGGLETFQFKKQDSISYPEYRKAEEGYYYFHLSSNIHDDSFYQGGYEFICWISQYSRNNGFIGYYKETLSENVNLIFVNHGEVIIQKAEKYGIFELKPELFDMPPVNKKKKRLKEDLDRYLEFPNYEAALNSANELIEMNPEDEYLISIRKYINEKIDEERKRTANKV